MKDLLNYLNLEAINIRLHGAATKLWHKINRRESIIHNRSMAVNLSRGNDHNWWPRTARVLAEEEPMPIYT